MKREAPEEKQQEATIACACPRSSHLQGSRWEGSAGAVVVVIIVAVVVGIVVVSSNEGGGQVGTIGQPLCSSFSSSSCGTISMAEGNIMVVGISIVVVSSIN